MNGRLRAAERVGKGLMKKTLLLLAVVALPAFAGEGKWTPQQVLELDPAWLKAQGLQVPPKRLWDPKRGTGLLAGAVNVGGCTGAFISSTGLVITNHHCVFSIVQEHSSPQRDLITQGFLATNREAELPGKGSRVQVPRSFTDVTKEVLAAVPAGADDLARYKAIERKQKELVAECEKRPATRCQVSVFSGGLQYVLVDAVELKDVRLVRAYTAPDGSSAAYSEQNVPYKAEFFFPLATQGVKPGDFVMVLGYPGITYRELLAEEMAERQARLYPRIIDMYGESIRILEEEGKRDPAGKIAVASTLKSLHNRHKNAGGQLAGLKRGRIIEKQREAEEAVMRWAEKREKFAPALSARMQLLSRVKDMGKTWEREFLLGNLRASAKGLSLSVGLARLARERAKPDLEREPEYMERELPRLKDLLEREQKNLFVPAEKRLLAAFVRRAQALGPEERIAAVDKHFGPKASEKEVAAKIDAMYAGTKLLTLAERMAMFNETEAQLAARKDPLLAFGMDLALEVSALDELKDRREGAALQLRPEWRRAVLAHAGKPVAPDANSTLRVSFAKVQGYSPRDGVFYTPQTTLRGMIDKHTNEEPFDVPDAVLAAAPGDLDLPVNFLADGDTTGGNSGSPVVNGRGELVGVNFDRVWENVANDFGFNPDIARNISADARYLLWMLRDVAKAEELLKEVGASK
jgi:hypothetical protein